MLTAYDYSMAVLLEKSGVDIILVGDSLANVVLGLDSTVQVGMEVMLHHTRAVLRGAIQTPVVADMPFEAYQPEGADALFHARRFMDIGCAAVKVEWFGRCLDVVELLVKAGVPVVGHIGLTPQTAEQLGGFKVQGRDAASAEAIKEQAMSLERAGCLALVLECVPETLAQAITRGLKIPTIGIGAGKHCDGQVLVVHDLLGFNNRKVPKFAKKYADLGAVIETAARQYTQEVKTGEFPGQEHSFR